MVMWKMVSNNVKKLMHDYLLDSNRRSVSSWLRELTVGRVSCMGQGRPVEDGSSFMGVISGDSGDATAWSGAGTAVSKSPACSSVVLSSISNEDCSWSFSSERQTGVCVVTYKHTTATCGSENY